MKFLILFLFCALFIIYKCDNNIDIGSKFEIGIFYPNPIQTSDTLTIGILIVGSPPTISSLTDVSILLYNTTDRITDTLNITGIFFLGKNEIGVLQKNKYTIEIRNEFSLVLQCLIADVEPNKNYKIEVITNQFKAKSSNYLIVF